VSSSIDSYYDTGSRIVIIGVGGHVGAGVRAVVVPGVATWAPPLSAPAGQSSNEGAATSFSLGSFADPGASDAPWAVDVNWGDGKIGRASCRGTEGNWGGLSHR